MAIGGPGFGSALWNADLADRQTRVQELRGQVEERTLGFRLAELEEQKQGQISQAIRKEFESALEGMMYLEKGIAAMGPNFKTGSPLDQSVDRQKNILAKTAKLAGFDPDIAQVMADRVRAAAQFHQKPVTMSPGQVMMDPATGQPVASVPQAPTEFERQIAALEARLGRKLTPQELAQKGGVTGSQTQAQSPAGKVVQDRQLFVSQYGENSPQVKAFDEAAAPTADLSDVGGVRKEFTGASKDFVVIRDNFGKIAAADPSGAGDLARIFAFMKMLDPGSTVREGEYANAQNAGGIPDKVIGLYNKAIDGAFLSEDQRKDFSKQAENIFKVQLRNQLQNEEQYRGIAKRNKMSEKDVVIDFIGPYRKAATPKPAGGGESSGSKEDPLGLRGGKK